MELLTMSTLWSNHLNHKNETLLHKLSKSQEPDLVPTEEVNVLSAL